MSEQYRPETWDEVVGQDVDRIRALIDGTSTPNFLFHGPPGTGKTTVAHLIAKEIQGDDSELMELNASDDRGIDTVREDVIPATNQTTLSGAPRVIFLDEMDSMTTDAQQALRQPMEQGKAVFVLACNDLGAVHDALQSRCDVTEFDHLQDRAIRRRVKQIAADEGVDLDRNELQMIVGFAAGDMRSAIQRYTQVVRGAIEPDDEGDSTDGATLEANANEFISGA